MANIDRIVQVNIALRTAGIQQQTFSDLLLLGNITIDNRVMVITEADQLLAAGLGVLSTDPLYLAAQTAFAQTPAPSRIFIGKRGATESVTDALAAIRAENNDWYGVSDVSHDPADALLAAAWAEANQKLFLTTISEADTITAAAQGLAHQLKLGQYFRTAWWYHSDDEKFPEVAAAARAFRELPGTETWANMRLSGVPATPLSEGSYLNVTAKNGNTFEPFRNIAITQNGKTAGGEWIDVIRFRDWLCEEIRTRAFQAFVDTRIPFTDPGISVIRQKVVDALDLGVRRGGIAPPEAVPGENKIIPSYVVEVPASVDVSANDKANRILRDVKFTARLAGAIHATEIRGVLTYENLGAIEA